MLKNRQFSLPFLQFPPLSRTLQLLLAHVVLLSYAAFALAPVGLVVINSVKSRRAIFREPYKVSLPENDIVDINPEFWDLRGYDILQENSNFRSYFQNSIIVTVGSLFLILSTGSMAAFALAEYPFPGNTLMGLYLAIGIMVPIRLGTVSILQLMVDLDLVNTLYALILVYAAQGLPLAVFILSQFMRQVPRDLKDAARVDGASEYRIYWMTLPLVRPAIGTVAVFNMIPIWNDLWFPLILAPSEGTKTITLGSQVFIGQFVRNWNAVLASLTLAVIPIMILYIIFSRQLIRGLTAGSVK
jgi:raffinose/stachyose/melibiose transport system permease protein